MAIKSILGIFSKIAKGDAGEQEVVESITKLLKSPNKEENFFIIPKAQVDDGMTNREVDVILLHPLYGLFVIEVKNWDKLVITEENNPFEQAKEYRNLLLSKIKDEFGKVAINVEFRVIFPQLNYGDARKFFEEHNELTAYKINSFFKEDLQSRENFKRFFKSHTPVLPNKKEFLKIASILVNKEKIKNSEDKIIPIISNDEVIYFDHKQLSILKGYTGGFRIIRGVAGTGKTIILSHFVNNKLNNGALENFLILCFNKKLVNNLNNIFDNHKYKENIKIESLFAFLNIISFDYEKCGINQNTSFADIYKSFESDIALKEFSEKLKIYLQTNPIDYFICDETQDMPAGFMRIIYEQINDCIFFIDEAQKFYTYSMDNISNIFHHEKFEKISMSGRVKNLKNVYRTPSNIAKCAFEILSNDKKLNQYYKKSYYLKDGFLSDINFILEDGKIYKDNWNSFDKLKQLLEEQNDNTIVLTHTKKQVEAINAIVKDIKKESLIKVMTIQSVKGLEASTVIIHNFDNFINTAYKKEKDIFYRKLYVLITRAQKRLFLSIDETKLKDKEIKDILSNLNNYLSDKKLEKENEQIEEYSLANLSKLKPTKEQVKTTGEFLVLGAELFAVIGGLFA